TVVFVAFVLGTGGHAAPLDEYVAQWDPNWGWSLQWDEIDEEGLRLVHVVFTSHEWKGTVWNHRLYIVIPPKVTEPKADGLYISGSGNGVGEVTAMKEMAKASQMPAAALMDIPNQPLFGGLKEDALIAYT